MTRFIRSTALYEERIGEELVALDVAGGQCYGMNSVATKVWELLSAPRSLEEICAILLQQFDVDEARCQQEVRELVDGMVQDGLVRSA